MEPDELGPPDLELCGLRIWVVGREYEQSEDYWDGNWLNVVACCASLSAEVWVRGPMVHLTGLRRWQLDLENVLRDLSGSAELATPEGDLSAVVEIDALGRGQMRVSITPDIMTENHSLTFQMDQSYLPEVIVSINQILAEYPIRTDRRRK